MKNNWYILEEHWRPIAIIRKVLSNTDKIIFFLNRIPFKQLNYAYYIINDNSLSTQKCWLMDLHPIIYIFFWFKKKSLWNLTKPVHINIELFLKKGLYRLTWCPSACTTSCNNHFVLWRNYISIGTWKFWKNAQTGKSSIPSLCLSHIWTCFYDDLNAERLGR